MTRSQGHQGPSITASRSATSGAALPQTSHPGQDWQEELKLFLRTQQDLKHVSGDMARHSWPKQGNWIHGTWNEPQLAGLTSERPAGLRDSRATDLRHTRRFCQTPTPNYSWLGRDDERQLPCRGPKRHEQTKNYQKTNKTKPGEYRE